MRYLLDTNCWLWSAGYSDRLLDRTKVLMSDPDNELYFSLVSAWEVALKYAAGKLPLPETPDRYIPRSLMKLRINTLNIDMLNVTSVYQLPMHHKDPFDRLLITQAIQEGLTIITSDKIFAAYDVDVILN